MIKILAQRSDSSYLVQIQKKKYALINLSTENVLYETDCDKFYQTGYFVQINPTQELTDRIKPLLDKRKN
ncbi:MAG: hypothetical protein ACC608_05490 [Anaerofustis sp.]